MSDSRFHSLRTFALCLIVFGLTIGATVLGAHRDNLYADAGRGDVETSRPAP